MSRVFKAFSGALALTLVFAGAVAALLSTDAARNRIQVWSRGTVIYNAAEVRFSVLEGFAMESLTSLRFGPDGRLYAGSRYGRLAALSVDRVSAGQYRAVETEEIPLIESMPNHNDNGAEQPEVSGRLITGLAAAGSAERPTLFVASSDPRLENPEADSNSGIVSRLDHVDGDWRKTDLVRGLPRSHADHATLGLHFDRAKELLYVSQGSNTNAGAPASLFHDLPEYALSAAILTVDLAALGDEPYDLPVLGESPSAPFGGRGGLHQALLMEDGPVRLYASGVRNAYRIVERDGSLYTVDNGPNPTYGGAPAIVDGAATNDRSEGGEHWPGALLELSAGVYYGHPNPTRASRRNRFGGLSPVAKERPEESFAAPPDKRPGQVLQFWASVNGLAVYESAKLGDEWENAFVAVGFDRTLRMVAAPRDGPPIERSLVDQAGEMPLDVTTRSDSQTLPGTIWVADYGSGRILVIEPIEAGGWLAALKTLPRRALAAFARWGQSLEPIRP